jgi:phosphoglycolate phosphatase-like HAD superfamily hydrolase
MTHGVLTTSPSSGVNRRVLLSTLALRPALSGPLLPVSGRAQTAAAGDLLPSWSDGPAKQTILAFVRTTIDRSSPGYVSPEDRIAVFDQDGTLWVEHPMYTQVVYGLERVFAVVAKRPELKNVEPFKTMLSGNREAMAKLSMPELEKILVATLTGMSVDEFNAEARKWLETARHPRWNRPYTELIYQPMLEVLRYLRDNAYKTYIVTGGGQDFVRVYTEKVYGIPPEQVVGTAAGTKFGYGRDGKPFLTKEPKLLLNDNNAGKPEGIHLMVGRRPYAAFGNSTGDRQMLRTLRHDRQCLGVDERLVSAGSPARAGSQSERPRIARSGVDPRPVAKPCHQGRLFSVRFQLLHTIIAQQRGSRRRSISARHIWASERS